MPKLGSVSSPKVESLCGIEEFRNLREISNFELTRQNHLLEPLRDLWRLTKLNFLKLQISCLERLRNLAELHAVRFGDVSDAIDLEPLKSIPMLHA